LRVRGLHVSGSPTQNVYRISIYHFVLVLNSVQKVNAVFCNNYLSSQEIARDCNAQQHRLLSPSGIQLRIDQGE
jgi:hypothetical protein